MVEKINVKKILDEIKLDDLIFENNFLVKFPEELNIRYQDIISVKNIENNTYRFVINNTENFPLFNLENYKNKQNNIFKKKKNNIIIYYMNKNLQILYSIVLKDIKILKFIENELTYKNDNPQSIIIDIKYKNRILNFNEEIYKTNNTSEIKK